jgi:dTDP-glucose 4,6-dehydratase
MRLFTTGGCGFIGSNFILDWINEKRGSLVNVDCLNYAGQLANLKEIENNPLYTFVHGNINNRSLICDTLAYNSPDCIIHFAAESLAINTPNQPEHFLVNNVIGTFNLLLNNHSDLFISQPAKYTEEMVGRLFLISLMILMQQAKQALIIL